MAESAPPMERMENNGLVIEEKQSAPGEEETLRMPASAEVVKGSAVVNVQALSPNLFWVMRIVRDKQDYGVVEKVQLPQNEILSLCNKLVPSSASASFGEPPRVHINFSSLNQQSGSYQPAVGFYGDKRMIIHTFRKESLVDGSVLTKMEERLLEPGLYVSLTDKVSYAVVFYWHEDEQLTQASRKDVSCNFIRYLVELCDSVYVCMEGSDPFEALEVLPGYNVRIDEGAHSKKSSLEPSANVQIANNCNGTAVFCEGYHHCCFLTTEKRAPWKLRKTVEVSAKASWSGKTEYELIVEELKKKMSPLKDDNCVTVTYERQTGSSCPGRSSQSEQVDVKAKVTIEEEHPFNIVYKACELTPMKKDISERNRNPGRPIALKRGESVELACINPQNERLYKVVVLKSRELIVFVHRFTDSSLYVYRCPKTGVNINNTDHPIHVFRRGFDLLAVDEATRSIALYEKETSKIAFYKFDESFRKVYWSGVEVNLESFNGSKIIVWMHFIPGKMELLLVDDAKRARVAEIREKPMMKAKHISLHPQKHPLRACVSVDGDFFLVFRQLQRQSEDKNGAGTSRVSPENVLDVYLLGDSMSRLKTIPLNSGEFSISDFEQFGAKFTKFGAQSQLLLYSPVDAPGIILSHVLKCCLAKEVKQLQVDQTKAPEDETEIALSYPYLGYIYHIFDKFAATPKLFPKDQERIITFNVVLESSRSDRSNSEACLEYLNALIRQLEEGKGKDFSRMKIQFKVKDVENCPISAAAQKRIEVKMGTWVRKLVCLVPIQIARAENNAMVVLKDGLQVSPDVSYVDSVSLSNSISFGFYDAVLSGWKGKIKVISSVGKQSSGKSYLLNHLSGSLFDVAGGRCTDGVWMSIVTGEEGDGSGGSSCLYVLLDFEALHGFERSEQEGMLLSVLNAAVSNITIFNQKGFHLDMVTEFAFSRFKSVINLLKQDKKLFKGLFYIAVKDVDKSHVCDLVKEFNEKISQIRIKSPENFISKMYDGKVQIAAMAPYNSSEYYKESLSELAKTVANRIDVCYDNGFSFLRDLKLITAQVASKDWASIDSKRFAVTVGILKRNLMSAVQMGCLSVPNKNEEFRVLVNFDTQEEIPESPVVVQGVPYDIKDLGLCLSPCTESATPATVRDMLFQIRSKLEKVLRGNGRNDGECHSLFQIFLVALADRRRKRVKEWISSNTTGFCDSDEVKSLKREAGEALDKVKQGLSVCRCKFCLISEMCAGEGPIA